MKDMLAQFMDDYESGRITIEDLQRRLAFDQWKNDKPIRLIDYVPNRRCPEDTIIAREDYEELYEGLVLLRNRVSVGTWKILYMTAYGYTQKTIGEALGITQPTVSKRIDKVFPIAKELGIDKLLRAVIAWK